MKSKRISHIYKKIQTHFLEFVMLFLAVFLGFVADNFRDGLVDKRIEKEYIQSLVEDIETDKSKIIETISFNDYRIKALDSLSSLCFTYSKHRNDEAMYKYYEGLNGNPYFFLPNEQTLIQLNYSGGLRLLTKKGVVKAILEYDHRKEELKQQQEDYEFIYRSTFALGLRLFNQQPFKTKASYRKRTGQIFNKRLKTSLLSNDTLLISEFANKVYLYQSNIMYYNVMLEDALSTADSLVIQIKKDYQLPKDK